jgi:hypothetical protein
MLIYTRRKFLNNKKIITILILRFLWYKEIQEILTMSTAALFSHPSYPDYGCDEKGQVYNLKLNHKLAAKPYKLTQKKANGDDKLQYRISVRKGTKYIQICLPRFVYECSNKCVLTKGVRVYKKVATEDNSPSNLYIKNQPLKKAAPQTKQQIDEAIAELQAQREALQE